MSPRALVLTAVALVGITVAGLGERADRRDGRQGRDAFALFAGPTTLLAVNDVQVTIDNLGNIGIPTVNGTFFLRWPKGSPNRYVFNSGLQIAGLIEGDAGPWTGDTVGAYFFDASGGGSTGWPRDEIYVSTNTVDLANWPLDAYVTDPELFPEALLGRKAASQQDTWTRYWDGDPIAAVGSVKHPMGIEVTQRSMAWTYPLGNETIIYWILGFKNVTNDLEFQQLNQLHYFGDVDVLPDEGWNLRDIYVAYAADPDIDQGVIDFSTAILPFNLGVAYAGDMTQVDFVYPPDIFFPPFFETAPGFFGIKYLKSPTDPTTGKEVGLTLFSSTHFELADYGGGGFPDPFGDDQLYRYLSGQFDPSQGDGICNVAPEIVTGDPATTEQSVCFVGQTAGDTRFYQASGPFTLEPGEQTTVAVAYLVAPTVERMPDGTLSGLEQSLSTVPQANRPGFPSFHPGFASARGCDPGGVNCRETLTAAENAVKIIERGAGWVSYDGLAPSSALESIDNRIDQHSVSVVPGSILGRALVAQTIFDNKFLLGFAPAPPPFYLVPGDNHVTVVWEPTPSEAEGDPFADAAADPNNRLYNPNYRRNDIEGYRVWRGEGTEIRDLELIAQFDYTNTSYVDYTCETILPEETIEPEGGDLGVARIDPFTGDTIGELTGYSRNEICPFADRPRELPIDQFLVFNNGAEGGPPGGGVSRNPDNTNDVVRLDTVIVSDPLLPLEDKIPLQDNGVPFTYIDDDVQNNFTYFYAVTAFDVNSPTTGPISLRSPKLTQLATPRRDAPNMKSGTLEMLISGDDAVPFDPLALQPTLDSDDGTFSGPFTPTNAWSTALAPLVERLLPKFRLELRIDSIQVRQSGNLASGTQEFPPSDTCTEVPDAEGALASPFGACWVAFLTADLDGSESTVLLPGFTPWWSAFGGPREVFPVGETSVPYDPAALRSFGIPTSLTTQPSASATARATQAIVNSASVGPQTRRGANFGFGQPLHGGPRWFDGSSAEGAINTIADPAKFRRAGHVSAADTIFTPQSHTPSAVGIEEAAESNAISFEKQCWVRALAFLGRQADVVWEWDGQGGFRGVRDITNQVDVTFHAAAGPTWGFLTADANGNGVIDWHDFNYIERAIDILRAVDGGDCNAVAGARFDAAGTASAVQLVNRIGALVPTSTAGMDTVVNLEDGEALPQTGIGFGLFAYGHRFIFEMNETPAAGTKWTLRSYVGVIDVADAAVDDPDGYRIQPSRTDAWLQGTPLIPGLRFTYEIETQTGPEGVPDLTQVHTVPDPYRGTSAFDLAPTEKQVMFVNLPYTGDAAHLFAVRDTGPGARARRFDRRRTARLRPP